MCPSDLPNNEKQLSEFLWAQLDLPEQMRGLTVHFINAEKKENTSQAQTEDAVKQWLMETPPALATHCWVVSSNPFIAYQKKVTHRGIKEVMPESTISVEGIGPEAPLRSFPQAIALGVLLDNLARTLYEEFKVDCKILQQ